MNFLHVILRQWRQRPARTSLSILSVAIAVAAVLGPALQPWYLTWVLPFVALARPSLRLQHLFLLVTTLCVVLAPLQDVMAPYMAMGVLALPAWLLWRRLRQGDVEVLDRCETLV